MNKYTWSMCTRHIVYKCESKLKHGLSRGLGMRLGKYSTLGSGLQRTEPSPTYILITRTVR
eukprot:3873-Amorphochlora_amoeboformis.AAC.1